MIEKIKDSFKFYYYLKPFGVNNLPKLQPNLSIFASPRGGSTWLAQTLKELTNSTLVWEPLFRHQQYKINFLNPFAYPEIAESKLFWNQYIPENAEWKEAEVFFSKLFSKQIVNLKLYRFNDISKIKNSNFFLFKFCFGNNLLPWLTNHYQIQPTLLLRHPCAVVASQLNYGAWNWHKQNFKFNYEMIKFNEFYAPYREILDSISCVEERLAANWAMTVLTPIKNKKNDIDWVTIAYEDLLINPDKALKKIKNRYNLEWDDRKLNNIINKQSFTKSSFNKNSKNNLNAWQTHLSIHQIDTIIRFIERLGVDFYSTNLEPDYSKIYK